MTIKSGKGKKRKRKNSRKTAERSQNEDTRRARDEDKANIKKNAGGTKRGRVGMHLVQKGTDMWSLNIIALEEKE